MKRPALVLGGLILAALAISLLVPKGRVANAVSADEARAQGQRPVPPAAPKKLVDDVVFESETVNRPLHPAARQDPGQARQQELRSLRDLTKTLFVATQTPRKMNELVEFLRTSRQEPVVTVDENAETGRMTIVRTKAPFPGTRYFHAQYFSDENEQPFVQHMSFEYRPGAKAFDEAQSAVKGSFGNLGKPTFQNRDFVQWSVGEGYVVWIKRMGRRDLEDDPFNAYTPNDIGTIRVAIELDINHH